MIVGIVVWALAAFCVALFAARGWSRGPWPAKSRGQLVRSGVDAVVALTLVRAVVPPPGPGAWLWVAAVVVVGVGIAGTVLHWRSTPPARRVWPTALYGVAGLALALVLA
jgi:hypothetical protein